MNLQGIVAVSGKPGLWKALTQNKSGFVLESLDEKKTKLVANISTAKLAALDEITIFGEDDDIRLTAIFERMKAAASVPDAKADGNKLRAFFREVAPDHDEEKVYTSDIKKVVSWFGILKDLPLFNEEPIAIAPAPVEEAVAVEAPVAIEAPSTVADEAPAKKKPAAKKAAK
jgi:hypothetical protein